MCSSYSDNADPPTSPLSEHLLSPSRQPPLPPTLFDPTQAAGQLLPSMLLSQSGSTSTPVLPGL